MRKVAAALCVAGACLWASSAGAEDVRVGIHVLSFGKLDMSTGTYTADF